MKDLEKLLKGLTPLSEQRSNINRQAENLSKEHLALLSPLLKEVNSRNTNFSIEELLEKAENIKKIAKNANKYYDNKS